MKKMIESVPNISEGRKEELIEDIADQIESTPGVFLLDVDPDPDHNRTVYTMAGKPSGIKKAIIKLFGSATEHIDLNTHQGEHPRMGAVDVVPFVPLQNFSMEECVKYSEEVARDIYDRFEVPVYLYNESAKQENRRNLSEIRRGEFEGFSDKIKKPEWAPDIGDSVIHPTAGVTAVGARQFLIAFNVNLGTEDVAVAKSIAKSVRESSGGLGFIKALGFEVEKEGRVQVSMNVENYEQTSLFQVFQLIKEEEIGRAHV